MARSAVAKSRQHLALGDLILTEGVSAGLVNFINGGLPDNQEGDDDGDDNKA